MLRIRQRGQRKQQPYALPIYGFNKHKVHKLPRRRCSSFAADSVRAAAAATAATAAAATATATAAATLFGQINNEKEK